MAAGAVDDKQDSLAHLVRYGIGYQFAGEQNRDLWVDGDIPGEDCRPHMAAGCGRCGRSCGQRDAPLALHGRADRCRRIHLVSLPGRAEQVREGASYLRGQAWAIPTRLLTLVVLVARQMLLQVADEDIGQVTDF